MPSPVLKPPPGRAAPLEDWDAYARQRGCYCQLWGSQPGHFAETKLEPGFCGRCERCGAPGHTRHFPGAVPYTGSWCDPCYGKVGRTWFVWHCVRIAVGFAILGLIGLAVVGLWRVISGS